MLFPSLNTPLFPPRNASGVPQAETLARWLVASFQALEKNYLRELIFLIYLDPTKPEVIHEKFTFTFSYDEGVISMGLEGSNKEKKKAVRMEELKGETQDLLRKLLVVTQGLDKLPDEAYLAIKLTYYDEVTPKDYEPEGFRPDFTKEVPMPAGSYRVSLGRADTGFHAIRLKMDSRQQGGEASFVNDSFGVESQSQSQQLSGETPGEIGGESSQSLGLEEKTYSGEDQQDTQLTLLLPARLPRLHRLSHGEAGAVLLPPGCCGLLPLPEHLPGPPDVGLLHLLHGPARYLLPPSL